MQQSSTPEHLARKQTKKDTYDKNRTRTHQITKSRNHEITPNNNMIGSSSSSLIVRWASGVLRERVALAATATLPTSWFSTPFFRELLGRSDAPTLPPPQPQLLLDGLSVLPEAQSQPQPQSEHIWFAVPKSKISRSRKRMKNTRQKRIPLKKNIVFDPRTGEVTLQHKLPYNWKDYLPKEE